MKFILLLFVLVNVKSDIQNIKEFILDSSNDIKQSPLISIKDGYCFLTRVYTNPEYNIYAGDNIICCKIYLTNDTWHMALVNKYVQKHVVCNATCLLNNSTASSTITTSTSTTTSLDETTTTTSGDTVTTTTTKSTSTTTTTTSTSVK
jgi:hypothetical protein